MSDIVTERSGSILRVQLNRPAKKNAMTSSMYIDLAGLLDEAAKDEHVRVVLWHGAGDSFCAGNDIEDFVKNPVGPGESPQSHLMASLLKFRKATRGRRSGCRHRRWNHYAHALRLRVRGRERQVPNALYQSRPVPEFGVSRSIHARIGYLRAADLGLVTRVVPDQNLLATATETAQKLAEKPASALQACKNLMKRSSREQIEQAMKAENEQYSTGLHSADTKEAFTAFFEKRPPDFTKIKQSAAK
jgi:enoyl-CoA hydratase/carnithine racemase